MEQKNTILTQTYEFLKMMIGVMQHFPRDQKFLIADRMQNLISDMLELFIEAYYSPPGDKKNKLLEANVKIEQLRYYVRLCYELGFYNSIKYGLIMEKMQEIGRMNGGWLKSLP
ncbi:MAG: diversity-generating retroelement protein Avd [Saprospiraceae bacterium]|nr:diversity-generating retroelement protein Avd [Saprospiraceae bacterium]